MQSGTESSRVLLENNAKLPGENVSRIYGLGLIGQGAETEFGREANANPPSAFICLEHR